MHILILNGLQRFAYMTCGGFRSTFPSTVTKQITIEEAYPVDSLLAHTYPTSVVLHSENINATQDEPFMTWDAVNGRFDNTTISYSFNRTSNRCLS